MRKIYILLFTALPLLCLSCVDSNTLAPTQALNTEEVLLHDVSPQDNLALKQLHAKNEQNYTYKNNALILGDARSSAKNKQLFLIYNRSIYPIILDFSKGHVGGTAGIMQMIQPNEWLAYLYIKGKDYRPSESSTDKPNFMRPIWTCQKGSPDYEKYNSCKKYLDIYNLNYDLNKLKTSHYPLDYRVLQILTYYNNRARWLTHVSYPSVQGLLMHIHVADSPSHPPK